MSVNNILSQVNHITDELEGSYRGQACIDKAYNDWCTTVMNEMSSKLKNCPVIKHGISNKKRKVGKPWWNQSLTECWNKLGVVEKKWLKSYVKSCVKSKNREDYRKARKCFYRQVQRAKCAHW